MRRWLAMLCGAVLFAALPALAQEAEEDEAEEQEETRRWTREAEEEDPFAKIPPPSPKIQQRRERALELYFDEKYDEAEQELDKIFFKRLSPVEKSLIHETYAYIATAREDREEARRRLLLAIEESEQMVRPDKLLDLGYKIAMLYVQDQMWKEAADTQEQWFQGAQQAASVGLAKPPNARAYYMLALTYYQLEEYEKALVPARKAVEMGDPPDEGWLQLLLGAHLIQKQYKEAIPVLEQLVALYPAKVHFMNFSTVYGALGEYERAAVPLQLAEEQGYLETDDELRRLAQLLLYLNLPYRAAKLLEEGFAAGRVKEDSDALAMLANSWIGAREFDRAVGPLERAAALAETGELWVRLAQVHVQRESWDDATAALRKGIDKGGLIDPGDANLLMGIAYYSQQRREEARTWFRRAVDFEKTRAEAEAWISHVEQELAVLQAAEDEAAYESAGG